MLIREKFNHLNFTFRTRGDPYDYRKNAIMTPAARALETETPPYRSPKEIAIAGARAARAEIRAGRHRDVTSGMAPAIVQANLAILPVEYANDFLRFCQLNPKPCPLIGMTEPGDPMLPMLGEDIDLRTDLPGEDIACGPICPPGCSRTVSRPTR